MGTRNCIMFGNIVAMFCVFFHVTEGITSGIEAQAMKTLMDSWKNTVPQGWNYNDNDPCGNLWMGITCEGTSITRLSLVSVNLVGNLPDEIEVLSQLESLDLSYNKGLTGPLPKTLGKLINLQELVVIGCSFNGNIPPELGNLVQLQFLALNSNNFSGEIPASLGNLAKLYWFDIASNSLTGELPVSDGNQPGLNKLISIQHFHFSQNQLSGEIPPSIFNPQMKLIHILFDNNKFTGSIPASIGNLTGLEALRLDRNSFSGEIPSQIDRLQNLQELVLSNNGLEGLIPNLSTLTALNYFDISNNSFSPSSIPAWLPKMENLTTIIMDNCSLIGEIPSQIFSLPNLETVSMIYNKLNGTVNVEPLASSPLGAVYLQNNFISEAKRSKESVILQLQGNMFCESDNSSPLCQNPNKEDNYQTSRQSCGEMKCKKKQKVNPQKCQCQEPYQGVLVFRAPSFTDLKNTQRYKLLENDLQKDLKILGGVFIKVEDFNGDNYLNIQTELYPTNNKSKFSMLEEAIIGHDLSSQVFDPPTEFGPFYFIAQEEIAEGKSSGMSTGAIAGLAVAGVVLAICCLLIGFYAVRQKRRADVAVKANKPFAAWASGKNPGGGLPTIKGARLFTFNELKMITNNFSEDNELGRGGYGMVYKAMLDGGQVVAIKRAKQGSLQGVEEFKTEVELLSRVHHKNLVGLLGFCFEQGEQMLVYEYISNGTLSEAIHEKKSFKLNWDRRVQITLGSARGLAYLHELANPPIIHRDIKTPNILLDKNLVAKVADFGLSKLVNEEEGEKAYLTTEVKGTLGYLDPEYYMTQLLSEKSDVYSFGIVMLELVTARHPIQEGKYIVRVVKSSLETEGGFTEDLLDPILRKEYQSSNGLVGIEKFLKLALMCVEESGQDRPSMREVVKQLENILELMNVTPDQLSRNQSLSKPRKLSSTFYDNLDVEMGNSSGTNFGKESDSNMFAYSGDPFFGRAVEPK